MFPANFVDEMNENTQLERINFDWYDYFYLFRTQVLCKYFFNVFKKDKNEITRHDLLIKLYEIGTKKIEKEFSIERVLT